MIRSVWDCLARIKLGLMVRAYSRSSFGRHRAGCHRSRQQCLFFSELEYWKWVSSRWYCLSQTGDKSSAHVLVSLGGNGRWRVTRKGIIHIKRVAVRASKGKLEMGI